MTITHFELRRVIDMFKSIDEAIAQEREIVEKSRQAMNFESEDNIDDDIKVNFLNCATKHEQFAEWLEELKIYQQHEIICNKGYNAGYNKALDDFVKALQEKIEKDLANPDLALECKKCGIWKNYDIEKIAEQLKAGDNNGT